MGRAADIDMLLGPRGYQEETAEALEAVGAAKPGGQAVIVIVFLLILLSILFYAASAGMAVSLPIGEIADADRPVPGVLWRRRLHRCGAWRARAARGLRLLGSAVLAVHGAGHLGAVLELRAGGGAAFPADGRDPAAHRALRAALQGAQRLAEALAGRPLAHQHRLLCRVLGDLGIERRYRRHDGIGGPALFRQDQLQPAHGARLAGRRRGARQPHSARHHLHSLRPHDRDLGRQALHRRRRAEPHRLRALLSRHPDRTGCGNGTAEKPPKATAQEKLRSIRRSGSRHRS